MYRFLKSPSTSNYSIMWVWDYHSAVLIWTTELPNTKNKNKEDEDEQQNDENREWSNQLSIQIMIMTAMLLIMMIG